MGGCRKALTWKKRDSHYKLPKIYSHLIWLLSCVESNWRISIPCYFSSSPFHKRTSPSTLLKTHLVLSMQPVSQSLVGWHQEALYHIISHGIWLERQMTEMAERRAINLKVLRGIKSLGTTVAVTVKCEEKVTLKVQGSVSIFLMR